MRKRKKKTSKNTRKVEWRNGTKKIKWAIYRTYIMNYEALRMRTFKGGVLS